MKEIEKLIIELLHEFDRMSLETIEDLRTEWIDQLKDGDTERYQRVESFVNAVCDVAINRVKKQLMEVA